MTDHHQLATLGRLWIDTLIADFDVDPETTVYRVKAKGPDGSEEVVAEVSLAETLRRFDQAGIRSLR